MTSSPTPEQSGPSAAHGVRVGIAAYTLWGLLTIYWKQLDAFDALELLWWRMVCASAVMAVVITLRRTWPAIGAAARDRNTRWRLCAAALLLSANWGSYVWAVTNDRVIETALGYFIAPLATMLIGVLVLGEQPTRAQRLSFVLAAIAVVVVTAANGQPPWVAIALAGTWSAYGLAKRQIGLGPFESLAGETFVLIVPAVAVLVVVSGRSQSVVSSASPRDWLFVLGTGAITALPLALFASAAKSIPFTLLGPLNLIVPVVNFGLGWLLYNEQLSLTTSIGFGFVWAALVVVMWDRIRSARAPAAHLQKDTPSVRP